MTREKTRCIREAALEDDSLTANARLLLSFIIDWHHKEKGCVMHDSTLGDRLGMSERTVQRRRKELVDAGYLRVVHGAHRRELVPQVADPSDSPDVRDVETHDTSDVSGDTGDETPDTSDDQPHDTSDVDREIYYPEGTRESAPAHEDGVGESPEDLFGALVDVWRSVSTAPALSEKTEDVLWSWAQDRTVDDVDLFREILQQQSADTTAKGCGLSPGILLKEYRKERDSGKLEPWQKEDERYSVDEQGRVCFMGTPVSETGPQNVYDDRKDGSTRPEPEVSPA